MDKTIKKPLKSFLDKNVSRRRKNAAYTTLALALVFFTAAWAGHSITDVAGSPSSDTVFYWIKTTLKRLDREYRRFVEKVLHMNKKYWIRQTPYLLIDETHESYTGKLLKKRWKTKKEKELCKYIHSYRTKKGDTGSFKFLTFALVGHTKKIIVRSIPVLADDGSKSPDGRRHTEDQTQHILETIRWIRNHVKFRLVVMDRGFYNEKLIQLLNKERVPYLIRARISETIRSMIGGLTTKWAAIEYYVGETLNKPGTKTTLVIGKDKSHEWALVTNRLPEQVWRLRHYYKKRWNIENIFQVCDGINVHTNSTIIEIKTLCFLISCLIYNLWQFCREKIKGLTLRKFTRMITTQLEVFLDKDPPKQKIKRLPMSFF